MEVQRMWWGPEKGRRVSAFWWQHTVWPAQAVPCNFMLLLKERAHHTVDDSLCGFVPFVAVHGAFLNASLNEHLIFCLKIGSVVFPSFAWKAGQS